MEKTQIDQWNMILTTENHFDDNPTVTTGYTLINNTKTALSAKIDALQLQINAQLHDTTGVTVAKNTLRNTLIESGHGIASVASGYASSVGNNVLYGRTRYSHSDWLRMTDAELVTNCINLKNDVNPVVASLAPGVTAAMVTAFGTNITSFQDIMRNPREAVSARATATMNISKLLPQIINDLLEQRLDNDVMALNATNPDFVSTYFNVRTIDSSPTANLSLTITCLDQDGSPLANVDINIDEGTVTRVSSARGYNTVQNLAEGSHTLTATKPGYADVTLSFVTVAEETLELLVTMHTV